MRLLYKCAKFAPDRSRGEHRSPSIILKLVKFALLFYRSRWNLAWYCTPWVHSFLPNLAPIGEWSEYKSPKLENLVLKSRLWRFSVVFRPAWATLGYIPIKRSPTCTHHAGVGACRWPFCRCCSGWAMLTVSSRLFLPLHPIEPVAIVYKKFWEIFYRQMPGVDYDLM